MLDAFVILIHLILWLLGLRWMRSRVRYAPLGNVFLPALLYKVLMGWLLGAVFIYYYRQGDTVNYFNEARQLALIAYQHPIDYLNVLMGQLPPPVSLTYQHQPRAYFFTKLVSIINVFTSNNYWLTAAYFSLASFIGSWKLASYLSYRFPQHRVAAAVAFLFYPSVVFWGSGILKESVAVAAIASIVYIVLQLQSGEIQGRRGGFKLLLLVVLALILWKVKYYYAAVLLPMLFAGVVAGHVGRRKGQKLMIMSFIGSWLLLVGVVTLLHPALALDRLLDMLLYNHDRIVQLSDPGNIIHFSKLTDDLGSFLKNAPLAIASGLFRPLVGEGQSLLQWAAGIENTVLLVAGGGAAVNGWRTRLMGTRTDRLWIVATIGYVVLLGGLLAFASPNFGSLVRYKVAFLPFMVFLVLVGNQRFVRMLGSRLKHLR